MRVRLPIHEGLSKQADEVGLLSESAGADLINCYADELGNIVRWAGYSEFADTSEGAYSVDGLYWWGAKSYVVALCNEKVFKITDATGTIAQISAGGGGDFNPATRASFAELGTTNLYIANLSKMNTVTATNVDEFADADAPTSVRSIAIMDRYLLANEVNTGNFHWSDVNAPTSWSGNYAEAESSSDVLWSLDARNSIIYLFGEKTIERWYNDGVTPFVKMYQGTIQSGVIFPTAVAWCPAINSFCYVDENANVVKLVDNVPQILSIGMSMYLKKKVSTGLDDIACDYVQVAGRPFLLIKIGTTEVIAYDFITGGWFRLGTWNAGTSTYNLYLGNCYCYSPTWNFTLMGGRNTGKIYKLAETTYAEGTGLLRAVVQSRIFDHGDPGKKKYCDSVTIKLKRNQANAATATPSISLQYRDGDSDDTAWTTAITLTLNDINETEFITQATRLGLSLIHI
jgi:hypothetical protein